ncbi:MAG: IS66 family transposase [Candidatus Omnitrophica bacterium]|nr:IS66 family transposase [Candidatus Omnitrophota bacterium]
MSKSKLYKRLLELEKENERLKEENAYLRFELEEFKSKRYKPNKKKPPIDKPFTEKPRKKGGLFGHTGWFRRKPKRIDRIEEVRLNKCPECDSLDIREYKTIEEHLQEDILIPRPEVTLYRKHKYYCRECKKLITAKGKNELPNSYIGPMTKSLAVFLKYAVKVSDRDIKNIFDKMFNLKIASSSIAGFRDQLKIHAQPIYEKLKESLKQSNFMHIDETGWRIDGEKSWLWKFSNKKICISHIDKSRGQKVVEDVLGKKYDGIIISDFLSAYNKITTKAKQRCLVHILRDLKKVIEYWHDDREVLGYCKHLKDIFEDAIELFKEYKDKERDRRFYRKRKLLTEELKDFSFPNPNKRILKRFAKRLNRHKDELFTFLYQKDIDYHNNHAEQQIRPDVIFRKITFGNRSIKGAENHSVLTSILQTAKLNNLDPLSVLQDILLPANKNPLARILAPPKQNHPLIEPQNNKASLIASAG